MDRLGHLNTVPTHECGDFCYNKFSCCRTYQRRECWLLISPILLLIFTAMVVEYNLNYALIRTTFWILSFLNLLVVISSILPICDKVWLFISDKTVSCLRKMRGSRNVNQNNQQSDDIIYCPGCCPCAFWPTPVQTLGTECATCCNFCFAVFVCIACGVLLVWKSALKADYDECLKYSDDCNDDHLDSYKSDLAQWIIYFIFAVLLAFFNCCVGRNLLVYRISQASHNETLFQSDAAVRPFAAVESVVVQQELPPQPPPPLNAFSEQYNNTLNTIEMVKLESGNVPEQLPEEKEKKREENQEEKKEENKQEEKQPEVVIISQNTIPGVVETKETENV